MNRGDRTTRRIAAPTARRAGAAFALVLAVAGNAGGEASVGPAPCWFVGDAPIAPERLARMQRAERVLLMIPGVSSGDAGTQREFLEGVLRVGGQDLALFYDWKPGTLSRRLAAPFATAFAAERLAGLCRRVQAAGGAPTLDVLAHSAGTVIVNKAARQLTVEGSPVRFRHVLLLGTALDAREPLAALMTRSAAILNVRSAYDRVNRNINDDLGLLPALSGGPYDNLRMDRSLGGRLMRHEAFLAPNPENEQAYGTYLGTGSWPAARALAPGDPATPPNLYGAARWMREHPDAPAEKLRARLPALLSDPDPEVRYYGVLLTGLLREDPLGGGLTAMLSDPRSPVYLRTEIYRALGNLRDPRYVEVLRAARGRDPPCEEEIRDVLRELKVERVE